MKAQIKLGRIAGISIGLHYSWFIIALLIALSLAGHFHVVNPHWSGRMLWSAAILTSALFFLALLLHELAHSLLAKARGLRVREITLFALGGVSQIESEAPDAKGEFWIAIVGPITSVTIGIVLVGLARLSGAKFGAEPSSPVVAVLLWLGYINIALAVFNMIPGYPLDGGRVLRAIAWRLTGNMVRATRIAAGVGQFIAVVFIVFGVLRFFAGGFGGLWLALIGWFLSQAAAARYAQVEASTVLSGVRVRDVMSADCPTIEGTTNLSAFAEEYLLRTGQRCFVVLENGHQAGLVTVHELKRIELERWPFTSVAQVSIPIDRIRTVAPDTNVTQALEMMVRDDVNQLPVISNGKLAGVISRGNVLQFLQTRAELKAA